ncbi:hypothetical protein ACHAWF_005917 [Thalassiosira exigua]
MPPSRSPRTPARGRRRRSRQRRRRPRRPRHRAVTAAADRHHRRRRPRLPPPRSLPPPHHRGTPDLPRLIPRAGLLRLLRPLPPRPPPPGVRVPPREGTQVRQRPLPPVVPAAVRGDRRVRGGGGVRQMSDWLRGDDGEWKRRGYERANAAQARIRKELVGDDEDKLTSKMGEFNADAFLESGVAGIPPSQTYNVKCVHAHVADQLCHRPPSSAFDDGDDGESRTSREPGNVIGTHALRFLQEERGVPVRGNDVCWQQCDVHRERSPSDWSYLAKKNRSGLRRRGSNSRTRKFRLDRDSDGAG